MKTFRQKAFSLIELMVTVGIAGIVLSIAVPSMSEFIKNERLTTATNTLISDLMLARSKALEMNQPVILCPSSNLTSCSSTSNYEDGWIVGVDGDNDGSIGSTDLIKVQQAIGKDVYIKDGGLKAIVFNEKGFTPDYDSADILSICDSRKDNHSKAISFSPTGRINRKGSPTC
jgi:type IV fimbrial biogenesis protein FimT